MAAPQNHDREYRSMRIEARDAEDGNESFEVTGYPTTFGQPYLLYRDGSYIVMEQVDPHAFDDCDMTDVIMQYDHRGRVFARTRNNTLSLSVEEKGLSMTARLGGTDIGRQLYQEIKGGYTDRMSFGFHCAEDARTITEDRDAGTTTVLRTLKRIDKLYDVSAVSIPANDQTSISARSLGDGLIAEARAAAKRERDKKALELRLHLF